VLYLQYLFYRWSIMLKIKTALMLQLFVLLHHFTLKTVQDF